MDDDSNSLADDGEVISSLRLLSTSTLGHVTDVGFARGLAPLWRPAKAVGHAFTVRLPQGDTTAVYEALDMLEAGQVLVLDTTGETTRASWGGVLTRAAIQAGVEAVVVDGPVTDSDELVQLGLSVWCRGVSALTSRRIGNKGQIQIPVTIGGSLVYPGDIVFADSDGVFVIPINEATRMVTILQERERHEGRTIRRMEAGERLSDIVRLAAEEESGASDRSA
jgi:4-hydroxy-4-methyl-2-oxoglutarate aldolase